VKSRTSIIGARLLSTRDHELDVLLQRLEILLVLDLVAEDLASPGSRRRLPSRRYVFEERSYRFARATASAGGEGGSGAARVPNRP
jgi:hypothetical protein